MDIKVFYALQIFALDRDLMDFTFKEVWNKFTEFVKKGTREKSPTKDDYLYISNWILYDASVEVRCGFSYGFMDKIIAKYHRIK